MLAQSFRMKGLAQEKPSQFEYRMIASDGRAVWLREISTFTVEAGVPKALRGVLFDITEHKHAEEELELLNKRLLESSRLAGMAEVATGVLHNVGNVLNSVNVSSLLIVDGLKKSKAGNLAKVVALLEESADDLSAFISADPRGRQLPRYLRQVSDHLAAEQA